MSSVSLKDFEIQKKLGDGSFASVFKVLRISDNKIYALKKVKMFNLKAKEKESSLNEVRLLASVSSDYIVGYKEAFIDHDELCIIMEFCPKGDVNKQNELHLKARTNYDEKELWRAFTHLLYGLKSLHDSSVLHRDLKCANVFINSEGNYKLGDFNVSKIAKQGLVYTQTGTPYYAAPEVWKEKPYNNKCDIWSLGCVIYEMCSLRPPFKASSMEGLYKEIKKGKFSRIPSIYSDELQHMIEQCLTLNPEKRPDVSTLINNPEIQKRNPVGGNSIFRLDLLETIKCPINLSLLMGKFPKSKYNECGSSGEVSTESEDRSVFEKQARVAQLKKLNSQISDNKKIKPEPLILPPIKNNSAVVQPQVARDVIPPRKSPYQEHQLYLMHPSDSMRRRIYSQKVDKQESLYMKQIEERLANRARNMIAEDIFQTKNHRNHSVNHRRPIY